MEWLTININPPKLDTNIIARKSVFGEYMYHIMEKSETSSEHHTEDSLIGLLENHSMTEWAELD